MKNHFLVLLAAMFLLAGCGPQIYLAPGFEKTKKNQKNLAILPFDVSIQSKKLPKGVTPEMIKDQEKANGYSMQDHVYSYFLRQVGKDNYTVEFQDIDKTNALLEKSGFTYDQLRTTAKEKICGILGVDAVVSGKVIMEKPMNEGAALAVGVVFGVWGNTNQVTTTVTIHDGKEGKLLWKYDYEASGSVGSSTESLAKSLMKNVSKKFPYKK